MSAAATPQVVEYSFDDSACQHKIVIEFNCDVSASLTASDLIVVNTTTRQWMPPDAVAVQYDASTNIATFTFPGMDDGRLNDGAYRVGLDADAVTGPGGAPMSESFEARFTRLTGDLNRDGAV